MLVPLRNVRIRVRPGRRMAGGHRLKSPPGLFPEHRPEVLESAGDEPDAREPRPPPAGGKRPPAGRGRAAGRPRGQGRDGGPAGRGAGPPRRRPGRPRHRPEGPHASTKPSVQDLETKRSKYKGQLMDVKTNKEYTAMLHEIEGGGARDPGPRGPDPGGDGAGRDPRRRGEARGSAVQGGRGSGPGRRRKALDAAAPEARGRGRAARGRAGQGGGDGARGRAGALRARGASCAGRRWPRPWTRCASSAT